MFVMVSLLVTVCLENAMDIFDCRIIGIYFHDKNAEASQFIIIEPVLEVIAIIDHF